MPAISPISSASTQHIAVLFALVLATTAPAGATTLIVAADGVDGPACGAKAAPCRSITRAIARAAAGDTIEVGPGRYGDLSGDGTFDDPGDEAAQIGTGCNCILRVTKRVAIVSRDGAGATLIDARNAVLNVVRIDAPGTVFGRKNRGFTVMRGGLDGIVSDADGIAIAGNAAVANLGNGINVTADRVAVTDNRALANLKAGFACSGTNESLFARNVAIANRDRGFTVDNDNVLIGNLATQNGEEGFNAQNGNALTGNVALGNGEQGFSLNDDNIFSGDIAVANQEDGFRLDERNVLTKCAALDNNGVGILVNDEGTVITKTSIVGNGSGSEIIPVTNANCGTLAADGVTLQATKNFWGAPGGPGADPADLACDGIGATTVTAPVATKEIKIRPRAAR